MGPEVVSAWKLGAVEPRRRLWGGVSMWVFEGEGGIYGAGRSSEDIL